MIRPRPAVPGPIPAAMPASPVPFRTVFLTLALGLAGSIVSCRRETVVTVAAVPVDIAPELTSNGLAGSPSTLLADQGLSSIHWQPWSQQTLDRAKRANRLVFAVICPPQYAESCRVLKALGNDPQLTAVINDNFVPVVVDSDACREMALLASSLCAEKKMPASVPLLVWFTPEGNPVAWLPTRIRSAGLREVFDQASGVALQSWHDSPDYVMSHSRLENQARAEKMAADAVCPPAGAQPGMDAIRAVRELTSYYDPGSHTFDNLGGLFPAGAMDLLADTALMPDVPADLVSRSKQAALGLAKDLSSSAMIDPLQGCIFNSRVGQGWGLPGFNSDCASQARAIVALCSAYRLDPDPALRGQILSAIAYAEKHHATPAGLFALGRPSLKPAEMWLWTLEEIEKALTPDELKVLTAVSDLRGLGNIPAESDPSREHFRHNILFEKIAPEAAAVTLALKPEIARACYESARQKLKKLSESRSIGEPADSRPHAVSTFRMASAYAAAYSATGESGLKLKAVSTLAHARAAFSTPGGGLQMFPGNADTLASGRAFLYAVAIQTALDLGEITLDESCQAWAGELAAAAAGRFMHDSTLIEVGAAQTLVQTPVSDRSMIFDDSSAGLLSSAEARLTKLGQPPPAVFLSSVSPLPEEVTECPMLHTDALAAALFRTRAPLVTVAADAPEALKDAVCRLPLRVIARRRAAPADAVPAGQAIVTFSDGMQKTIDASTIVATIFAGDFQR